MNSLVSRVKGSRRASAAVVAVLIVLVAAAAWVAVVSPKRSDATSLKSQVADAQVQLATATQQAASANRETAAAADRALPSTADQPGILDDLNRLGKKTGVLVATVSPAAGGITGSVSLTVTVDGTYFQIHDFLQKLRNQVKVTKDGHVAATGRLFDVQGVNISAGQGANQLAAQITMSASVYAGAIVPATTPSTTATAAAATGTSN